MRHGVLLVCVCSVVCFVRACCRDAKEISTTFAAGQADIAKIISQFKIISNLKENLILIDDSSFGSSIVSREPQPN